MKDAVSFARVGTAPACRQAADVVLRVVAPVEQGVAGLVGLRPSPNTSSTAVSRSPRLARRRRSLASALRTVTHTPVPAGRELLLPAQQEHQPQLDGADHRVRDLPAGLQHEPGLVEAPPADDQLGDEVVCPGRGRILLQQLGQPLESTGVAMIFG